MSKDNKGQALQFLFRITLWLAAATILAGCGGSSGGYSMPPAETITYPSSSLTFVAGTAIAPFVPTATEGLSGFTVTPALPAGLSLSAVNGTISGTPTAASAAATYTVAATAAGVTASTTVSITVNPAAPSSVNYGSAAFSFTANIAARTLTPTAQGGAATSWGISPSLPAGLTFDTSTGAISGTPSAASASASYMVTAQNAGGQTTANLAIEVDASPLLDLGHDSPIAVLRMSGSSVLSVDQSGHWNLWDYTSAAEIASGDLYCSPNCGLLGGGFPHLADMAGNTVVLATASGFELLSATNGQLLSNITASVTWWSVASDGSYLTAGSSTGLLAWSPSGTSLVSLSGNYSTANAFAAPGQIQVAVGPAGQDVIQTVSVPGGASATGTAFSGQFNSWFLDGSRFIATAGTTVTVHSAAGAQVAVLQFASAGQFAGEGNWIWNAGAQLQVYPVASSSSPVPSLTISSYGTAIPSGTTLAVSTGGGIEVIDLSGSTLSETSYNNSAGANLSAYAATSTSQWMFSNGHGVLVDGASLTGTPRYFDYGAVTGIAGSNGSIAVATSSGRVVYFDAGTLAQEGAIPFAGSQVQLSSDGTILAAADDLGGSINIYSLPGGGLTYNWSATGVQEISLSGTGTVLGQVLFAGSAYTQQANPATGGAAIFSNTFAATQLPSAPPVLVSPDGTLIATSASTPATGGNAGTNILKNGTLAAAVTGVPIGWIDNGDLLVNTYVLQALSAYVYGGCSVVSPTGQSTGACALSQQVTAFQPVTSSSVYAINLGSILSVSTGAVSWTSGDSASLTAGAVAGNRIVFVSGADVLAQGY